MLILEHPDLSFGDEQPLLKAAKLAALWRRRHDKSTWFPQLHVLAGLYSLRFAEFQTLLAAASLSRPCSPVELVTPSRH